ncbi:AraC family transcriptional regulator [Bacillus sp. JCM 19041]|uniref:helix-turn-helix domain-containing protein n=1 Tax=Bacillus sp. JCM 19041 TaxID=1460637 RepID=UPI0006D2B699
MSYQSKEIDQALNYIQDHLHDPLTLHRLAKEVSYSPYHFSRIFKERTGLPPLYYVSTMRLQRAKELLLTTDFDVRDIGMEIGQQSLGTFTSRFTKSVGLPPAQFRQSVHSTNNIVHALQQLKKFPMSTPHLQSEDSVSGTISANVPLNGIILVGLFTKALPEGLPEYGTLLDSLGDFSFKNVHPGTYYLMATSISWGIESKQILLPHKTLRTRAPKPIIIKKGERVAHQNLHLHSPRLDDPPILVSLPLLMQSFLTRITRMNQ